MNVKVPGEDVRTRYPTPGWRLFTSAGCHIEPSQERMYCIVEVEVRVQGEVNGSPMSCQEPVADSVKGEEGGVPVIVTSLAFPVLRTR